MGKVIRAYRRHPYHGRRGLTQEDVAAWAGMSQGQVSAIENGPAGKRLDHLISWAQLLGIPEEHLWFRLPAAGPPGQRRESADTEAGDSATGVGGIEESWPGTLDELRRDYPSLWRRELDSANDAADSIDHAAILRWLVSARDATASADGRQRVGRSDVHRLRAGRAHLKAIDNLHGGGTAFPMSAAYLQLAARPMLAGRYDDTVGRQLFAAVGELVLEVGWMAYDAGDQHLARNYMLQALRLSHAADDRLFGGRVLAAMSHQALHLGDVRLAVDLTRSARAGTAEVATPRAVAMLAAMEACAQAAAGNRSSCARALADAEAALDDTSPDEVVPEWLDFDEGGLRGHAARAWRDLHEPDAAMESAQLSITQCREGHTRTRAQRHAILATAHLQRGDVDQAAAVGTVIVADAWQLRSSHVDTEVATLARAVAARPSRTTQDFLDQAYELLADRQS